MQNKKYSLKKEQPMQFSTFPKTTDTSKTDTGTMSFDFASYWTPAQSTITYKNACILTPWSLIYGYHFYPDSGGDTFLRSLATVCNVTRRQYREDH